MKPSEIESMQAADSVAVFNKYLEPLGYVITGSRDVDIVCQLMDITKDLHERLQNER